MAGKLQQGSRRRVGKNLDESEAQCHSNAIGQLGRACPHDRGGCNLSRDPTDTTSAREDTCQGTLHPKNFPQPQNEEERGKHKEKNHQQTGLSNLANFFEAVKATHEHDASLENHG
jgi:hypothetical protein